MPALLASLPRRLMLALAAAGLVAAGVPAAVASASDSAGDPSGVVTDQYGRLVVGATVTLLRSDNQGGPYTQASAGFLTGSNKVNPGTTGSDGAFGWGVSAGWYEVQATAAGCDTATTAELQVPPDHTLLLLKLTCSAEAPAPSTAPSVSGTPAVGQKLTAVAATWAAPLSSRNLQLLRNGNPLFSSSYTVTAADIGVTFTARSTGQRPDYVQEGGAGATVTFTGVTVTSAGVVGQIGAPPAVLQPPAVTGTPRIGATLTATDPVWSPSAGTQRQWLRDGVPLGASASTYRVTAADFGHLISVRATSLKPGYATATATSAGVRILAATSTTKLRLKSATVAKGSPATVVVTVTASGVTPTGKVKIKEGRTILAKGRLHQGRLTVTVRLSRGLHRLKAVYAGSATVLGSRSKVARLTVV